MLFAGDELGGGGGGGPGGGGGAGHEDAGAGVLADTGVDDDCPLSDGGGALIKFPRFNELLPPKAQTASLNLYPHLE